MNARSWSIPSRRTCLQLAAAATAAAVLAGCQEQPKQEAKSEPPKPAMNSLQGSVAAGEPVQLDGGAKVTVRLLDISKQDAKADVVAETTVETKALPVDYALTYDPAALKPNMRYALRAQVTQDGKLAYTTTEVVPVTAGDKRIDLTVSKVKSKPAPATGPINNWQATKVSGVAALLPGATLALTGDGRASGGSGCNAFSGTFKSSGADGLEFGPLAATRKMCPPELMAQEKAYFDALAAVRKWSLNAAGNALTLSGADGAALVELARQ